MSCVVKAFAPLQQYGFSVTDDRPLGPTPRNVIYTNGSTSIIAGLDVLEGELSVKIAHRDQPAVDLVELLEDQTGRSLHLQHLSASATKGVVTSRLTMAIRAIEQHLPQVLSS